MTVTSANPDDLGHFVRNAGRARETLTDRLERLVSTQNAALAGCIDYAVPPNAVSGAIRVFQALVQNEKYVATVRTELLAADRDPNTGIATVSSASVAAALQAAGVARKPPPVEVEPGMKLGISPTSGFVDDPICAANGNFVQVERDLTFPGWAAVLGVVRTYNSLAAGTVGAFGPGWSSAFDLRIDHVEGGVLRVRLADGAVIPFSGDGPELRAPGTRPLRVTVLDEGWLLHEGRTKTWRFDGAGRFVGGVAGPATLLVERDDLDRVVEVSELRSGRRLRIEWDASRIAAIAASDGRVVSYRYDDRGVLVGVERATGAMTYTVDGNLVTVMTDADGVVLARNVYDVDGRVVEQTNEFGRTTRYEYSDLGTTVVTDTIEGPRNALTHDARGNLTSMVDGAGRALRLTYDEAGHVTSVRDRAGATTHYAYDERGNLVERVDPDGLTATWSWDEVDRLVAETDRSGASTTYAYDGDDRRPSTVVSPGGATTRITLLHGAVPAEIVDPDGIATRFEWDADGQLVAVIDALGNRTTFAFDDAGSVVSVVDASGVATALRVDGAGRVVESVVADAVCGYRYTAAGRPLGGHDGEGVSWRASYGVNGRVDRFVDGEGSVIGFEWDPFGNLATVVAPDGGRYVHHHDAMGNLVGATDPQGHRSTRDLDGEGRVLAVTDAAGRTWRREVDAFGRTVTSIAPDGATTRYRYHAVGTVQEVVHQDGSRVVSEVDEAGRVIAITDARGGRFELRYSPAGRLLERRSPTGRVHRYGYDDAGRLVSAPGAPGDQVALDLDPRGRVLARTSSSRGRVSYDYNDAGELIGITGPSATTIAERDRAGRITAVSDGAGARSTFAWDDRGLVGAATDAAGLAATFARDIRGRVATTTAANGDVTSFDYDPTGYLRALTDPAGTLTRLLDPTGVVTGIRHDDGSGVDRTMDAGGRTTSISSATGERLAEFSYDAGGRLRDARRGDATIRYDWTATGRLAGIRTPTGEVVLERDGDGLLTRWSTGDGVGVGIERGDDGEVVALVDGSRRVPHPGRPDVERDRGGRITGGAGGAVHRYDAAGRLVETLDRNGGRWRFTYGADGLLAEEDGPLGRRRYERGFLGRLERLESGDDVTTFAYDAAGRRVRATSTDGTERRWIWDALGVLLATEEVDHGGTVHRVDFAVDAFGRPYRIGDVAVIWDDARTGKPLTIGGERLLHLGGAVATAATATALDAPADPWGSDGVAAPHCGFKNELAVGDLIWMGERVYDARTREFLSPDPLLAVAGRPGHAGAYSFGYLDPVNFLDPTGRRPVSQQDFDKIREREEDGRLGQAWNAITDDPWGTLAMVGIVAVGVGLMFVPGGQVFGVGILLGAASSAAVGVATGNFSPTDVAVGGAFGLIPGGSSYRTAIAVGAASGAGQELMMQTIRGDGYDWNMVAIQTVTGGATGGLGHRLTGARPSVDTPTPPTAPLPEPVRRPSFAVDSTGTAHPVPPPGGVIEVERYAPRPVKPENATDAWDDFLGDGPRTNIHPRTGELDPNRIVSADGTRSIRYGPHEMGSNPNRHHYHEETWTYDPNLDVWWVDSTVVRVPLR